MQRTFQLLGLWSLAFLLCAGMCQADLIPPGGRPRPRPRPDTPVAPVVPRDDASVPIVIKVDATAKSAKLQIPQKLLPKTQLSQNDEPARNRTIIAGIALSAAIAGVVLVRGRSRAARATAVCALLVAGVFGAVQIVSADIAPRRPQEFRPIVVGDGHRVAIEIVKKGDNVTLTLPPNMLPQAAGAASTTSELQP